jgi:murein DD-endopeptidase MepM/ murein hydrolase activator NlpD
VTAPRIIVLLLILWLPFSGIWKMINQRRFEARQKIVLCQKEIDRLQKYNRLLSQKLRMKEQEKRQIASLAAEKSVRLHEDLTRQGKQLQQLWRVVGKKPAQTRRRTSMKGSRRKLNVIQIRRKFDHLDLEILRRDEELRNLRCAVEAYKKEIAERTRREMLSRIPDLWPVRGSLSSTFGYRSHPVTGGWCFHSGVDITAPYGTPIYSTAAGIVTFASYRGGFGNTVIIDHGNGITTLYGHCSSLNVRAGRFVRKGDLIAFVGSSGTSTGCHVHYEVARGGGAVDPMAYMRKHRSELGSLAAAQ